MPRCPRTSVSKNDAGKSDDPTSYAASHIAHIRRMVRRTAAQRFLSWLSKEASRVNARTLLSDYDGQSCLPLEGALAHHTVTLFLNSPLSRFAGTASMREPSIHLFGNTRQPTKWTSPDASYDPTSLTYNSPTNRHLKTDKSLKNRQGTGKKEDEIRIGEEEGRERGWSRRAHGC